jgi:hypothetical protein
MLLQTFSHDGVAAGASGDTCGKVDEVDPLMLTAEVSDCDAVIAQVEGLEVFVTAVDGLGGQGTPNHSVN